LCFNLLVRAAWMLALLFGWAYPILPQSSPPAAAAANYPYLLRIQRIIPPLDTCVLLRQDGGYHLERDHEDTTEVYEGELSVEELSRVREWLENERLRNLTRDQLMTPLVIAGVDNLQINIFRGDHWQDLFFSSTESEAPFRESLGPLLEWFSALHKEPHRTVPEGSGKHNCMPTGRIELKTRPEATVQTGQSAGAAVQGSTGADAATVAPFLMRLEYSRFVDRAIEGTCAIVYASGRYRVEKSHYDFGGEPNAQVHEASLDESGLRGLRQLLDDPVLATLEQGESPAGNVVFADHISVWIPRDKKVQHLAFTTNAHIEAAIGGHYIVNDKNSKLVQPLQKWVLKLPADKANLIKGAAANRCRPN
jgi:hypothetical protein